MDRYNTYRADISITREGPRAVFWRIDSTGRSGKCLFTSNNQFIRIAVARQEPHYRSTGAIYWNAQAGKWVAPDGGICHTCTAQNGFPIPPSMMEGYFYLPDDRLWYDPDGHECYTCNPQNGFPIPPESGVSKAPKGKGLLKDFLDTAVDEIFK